MPYSDEKSRKLGCVVLIGFAILLILTPVGWLMGRPYTSSLPRPFNSEVWKAAKPETSLDDDTRCGMMTDLRMRIGIEGKTREELVALLGEPEKWRTSPKDEYWPLCPSFLDLWVLSIRWEDGRAVEAMVHDT